MASKALAEVFSAVDWRLTGLIGFWVGMPPAVFLCDLHFYFLAAGGVISRSSTTGGDTRRHMIDKGQNQENSSQPTHHSSPATTGILQLLGGDPKCFYFVFKSPWPNQWLTAG